MFVQARTFNVSKKSVEIGVHFQNVETVVSLWIKREGKHALLADLLFHGY